MCIGPQGEFAPPARDCRVVARVTGWNNRLQLSRLVETGCPARAPAQLVPPIGLHRHRVRVFIG